MVPAASHALPHASTHLYVCCQRLVQLSLELARCRAQAGVRPAHQRVLNGVTDRLWCDVRCPLYLFSGNIIGRTQTLTLFVESAYKEYNSEAAFAAAVLLSVLALCTLWVKDKVEQAAAAEAAK